MKKYLLSLLLIFPFMVYSQTEIFNVAGGGALPADWVGNNNVATNDIDRSSYYLLDSGDPSDELITATYDLSSYNSAELTARIASFGSGDHNTLQVEVSTDGGINFSVVGTSVPTTGSSYIDSGTFFISNLSSTIVIKLTNSGSSGRGVRLQNIILNAFTSDPSITSSVSSIEGLGYVSGNSSLVSESFNVSGLNLTEDITISVPQDFEASLDGTTFSNDNIILDGSSGSVSATTVYVKLSSALSTNTYTDNLVISSSGVSTNVAISAAVYADPFVQDLSQDLFFSEYSEGSSNNKYLEIYNPTDQTVDLSSYAIASVSNDPTIVGWHEFFNTFNTGATIAPGETYVWANSSSDQTILNAVSISGETGTAFFNGDDGYALAKGTSESYVILDIIGDFNGDPGNGWSVAGVADATKDKTLVRKSSVTQGNNDFTASAGTSPEDSEWIVYDQNTWTYIGTHTFSIFDFADQIIKVYPNPVSSNLNFSGLTSAVQVSVYDMTGRLHMQKEIKNTLDMSSLKAGIYMVKIQNENGSKVFNVLKN